MERIGDDVRGALKRVGVPDAGVLAAVTRAWPAAVGPAIARSAWPLRIGRDGTLHVAVESAVWAHELALLEPELRKQLTAGLGSEAACPSAFRFAVGPIPAAGDDPRTAPVAAAVPGAEETSVAASVASVIEDPELREIVRRAAAASLAAHRSDRRV
jgi:hypothetical protein